MGKLKSTWPTLTMVALCAVIICARLHTYREPLERDLTTYAVIAHEMLASKLLYRDVWDHKPPAIHLTYAAAEVIAGYGRNSILLMGVIAAIATLFACYSAGSSAGGGRIGGCFAAALWALICGNLVLEGNQPNTEVFINACLTTAFAFLVRGEEKNLGPRNAILVGLFFALASLYKPVAVAPAALLALVYCACRRRGVRKQALADVAIIGLIGISLWSVVFVYFFAHRSALAFIESVFTYNDYYASHAWHHNLSTSRNWPIVSADIIAVLLPMSVVALYGFLHGLKSGPRRHWILLGTYAIASEIAVLLPGWFFRHYYQLLLPPLAIGTGWTIASLKRILPVKFRPLSYATGLSVCVSAVIAQIPDYRDSAEEWSRKKYGGIFLSSERIAPDIDKLLEPQATFYHWGNETGLYFVTGRRPPSGVVFAYPVLDGPLVTKLSARVLEDLKHSPPELVIMGTETLGKTPADHPVLIWCKANYRLMAQTSTFEVWARKGGSLEGRLASKPPISAPKVVWHTQN